jgi:hypothetical protein
MAARVDGRLADPFVPQDDILIGNKTTCTPKTGSIAIVWLTMPDRPS